MKPILLTRADVAQIIRVRLRHHPESRRRFGVTPSLLERIAAGRARPTPSVLHELNLSQTKQGYQWNPS